MKKILCSMLAFCFILFSSTASVFALTGPTKETNVTNQCPSYLNNCVKWVRTYRVKNLPYGLTYYSAKARIINSHTATAGEAAIIKTRRAYGHIAYVKSVHGNQITIEEVNWAGHFVDVRTGTASELNISGYFR